MQQEAADTRHQLQDVAARMKDLERKNRSVEAEYQQVKDDLAGAEKARRAAEAERDELQEEAQANVPKMYV